METRKAIAIARERELEVVVVSEKADPPVAKITDYNRLCAPNYLKDY